ncbi:MAG: nucleotidyltransferase family protein [Gammaproteobacteria bacterium]|nr:nucleotidyltransferase family protein [Gammaproteobacteria bacterium]NND59010.1 nucleotidyltransferase family protein [Gammaproteobacteria bacterium]
MTVSAADLTAIVPAAGAARRYGKSKLSDNIDGTTLLQRCLAQLQPVTPNIVVVTGAHADSVAKSIPGDCLSVHNSNWHRGLGSSIATAMVAVKTKAALIVLPDQAMITTAHLQQLLKLWQQRPAAIACAHYNGINGVPAIFPARLFDQLAELDDDYGARHLVEADGEVVALPLPEAAIDIDKPTDLDLL